MIATAVASRLSLTFALLSMTNHAEGEADVEVEVEWNVAAQVDGAVVVQTVPQDQEVQSLQERLHLAWMMNWTFPVWSNLQLKFLEDQAFKVFLSFCV